ncbi:transcription factor ETV7 isoform 3-T3 [Polymixia lowei]
MEFISPSPLVKQENRGSSPLSMVSLTPDRQVVVPPAGSLSPPAQLPLVCPSSQEDLWHLPGRLRINPSLWDKEDVAHWLHWAQREYSLRRPEKGCFEMNGRALCLLTKEDFRRRCPSAGDVLYEILQCVKQHKKGVVCNPPNPCGPGLIQATIRHSVHSSLIQQTPNRSVQGPRPSTTNGTQVPNVQAQCPPKPLGVREEPLNLSSRERGRSPHREGRIPECRLLWDYVYQLLCDSHYQAYIRWEDPEGLVFKVVDPNGLARLWGNHKSRANMTYEKMSRALRHYYKLNIIKKEPGQKLLFRFLKTPQEIRTQRADPTESPAHTPPRNGNSPDHTPPQDRESPEYTPPRDGGSPGHTPPQEFNEDQFEVSPEPASPQQVDFQ